MRTKLWKPVAGVAALAGLLVAAAWTGFPDWLGTLSAWTGERGVAGMLAFAMLAGVAVVFFFPGSVLMTASGAAFGLVRGFLIAQAGASLGAGLAFLVSRHLARRRVERWVQAKPAFAAIDEAIGREGWKIVFLTRCCPLFPYIFQNYAYGLTRVRFGHYAVGSFLGLVPATLVFAYMGSLGRSGTAAVLGEAGHWELVFRILGFAATVALSVYVARVARRGLEKSGV